MPISICELFATAEVKPAGVVRWGTPVPSHAPGIYSLSWSADPAATTVSKPNYIPLPTAYAHLLSERQDLSVDGIPATPNLLAERLRRFWIPNEPILYIGKAGTSLRTRVRQYYSTKLGDRSPHAGGWWLKTLDELDQLHIHFALCADVTEREQQMLATFAGAIDPVHRTQLFDSERVAPFANVETSNRLNKRHGLLHYKDNSGSVHEEAEKQTTDRQDSSLPDEITDVFEATTAIRTQPVTDKDRTRSYLRIPSASKHAFPEAPARIKVVLDGIQSEAAWRPNGTRSGTISVGVDYMRRLRERGEHLTIQVHNGAYRVLLR